MVKAATTAKMDLANKAMCFSLRNPPPGYDKVPLDVALPFVFPTLGLVIHICLLSVFVLAHCFWIGHEMNVGNPPN